MRRLVLALAIVASAASAGDWHPNPDERYRLVVSGSGNPVTEDDKRWAESLVANLRKKGGIVRSWEIAPRYPSAIVTLNEASTDYRVFRQGDRSRYLLIERSRGRESFLVDFDKKYVLAIGGIGTTTVHVHPSERFAVVIYSHAALVYGIPVSEYSNATFEDQSASWLGGES